MTPFERGKALVWNGLVGDTLAPSYVDAGSLTSGIAGARVETLKLQKYNDTEASNYLVAPLVFDTLGGPSPATRLLLNTVGSMVEEAPGCKRAREYLLQRLLLDVQRGNAAALMGTLSTYTGPYIEVPS